HGLGAERRSHLLDAEDLQVYWKRARGDAGGEVLGCLLGEARSAAVDDGVAAENRLQRHRVDQQLRADRRRRGGGETAGVVVLGDLIRIGPGWVLPVVDVVLRQVQPGREVPLGTVGGRAGVRISRARGD